MRKFRQNIIRRSMPEDAGYAAIDVLKHTLDMFKDVASNIGVPGLEAGVGVLSTVLQIIQVRPTCSTPCIDIDAHTVTRMRMEILKLSTTWRRS